MKNKILIFIITGAAQMGLGRLIGVHDGLEHMVFTHWWEYAIEGLLYSICHYSIYKYVTNKN